MLKVGLVGLGGISGAHVAGWNAAEGAELVAICDVREEQLAKHQNVNKYSDFHQMLEEEKLDILDICLPTYLHTQCALEAMKRGIHVLCEKPISLEESDVALLYQAALENNVKFMVAQVIRFWPEYMALKEIYETKRYGELLSGEMERLEAQPRYSWDSWMPDVKRSGAVSYDLHIHELDYLIYVFGEPEKIDYHRVKRPEQDYLQGVYSYPAFSIDTEAAWYAADYPFHMSFRFQFEKAVVAYENAKLTVYLRDGSSFCPLESGAEGFEQIPRDDGYTNEIRYFASCVRFHQPQDIVKQRELETVLKIAKTLE